MSSWTHSRVSYRRLSGWDYICLGMRHGPEVCSSSAQVLVVLGFHQARAILSMVLKGFTGNVLRCISIGFRVPRLSAGMLRVRGLGGVLLDHRPRPS